MARYNANNSLGFEILSNNEVQNAVDNEAQFKNSLMRKKYMTFGKLLDQTDTIKKGGHLGRPIYKKLGIVIIKDICDELHHYVEIEKTTGKVYFKVFVSYYLGLNMVSDKRKIEHAMGRFNSELELALNTKNREKIIGDFIFSGSSNNKPRHVSPFANIEEEKLAMKFLSGFKKNSKIVIKDSIVQLFIILIIKEWCMDFKINPVFKSNRIETCIVGEVFRLVHGFDSEVVKELVEDLNSERMVEEMEALPDDEDLDLQQRIRELRRELYGITGDDINPRGIKRKRSKIGKKGSKKKGSKKKGSKKRREKGSKKKGSKKKSGGGNKTKKSKKNHSKKNIKCLFTGKPVTLYIDYKGGLYGLCCQHCVNPLKKMVDEKNKKIKNVKLTQQEIKKLKLRKI